MPNRWEGREHPNPLQKFFRPRLGPPWEPTDQRSRGQINSPSSRSHGLGQQLIADTFLPHCSEPQQGHPEPLKPSCFSHHYCLLASILFELRNLQDWFTVLYCACPQVLEHGCYPNNLRGWLFLFSRQKSRDLITFSRPELLLFFFERVIKVNCSEGHIHFTHSKKQKQAKSHCK